MKGILATIIVIFGTFYVYGQDFANTGDEIEWSIGQVSLTSGATLNGALKYNTKKGLLSFDNGKESKVLTPRSVVSFEYHDEINHEQRKFFSIEIEDAKGIKRPQFVEVLKELKTFAVITAHNPLELKKIAKWDPVFGYMNAGNSNNGYVNKTVASQIEILYLLDTEGDINPYLMISNEEMPRTFTDDTKTKVKTKVVGEEFLKKLTAPYYDELRSFAKDSKLSFSDKEEFFKILDHYHQLTATNN
jgi:hypothetical protein